MKNKIRVNSWDLWDTLISRCVIKPTDIFYIVEDKTELKGFARQRLLAEKKSRIGVIETDLDRIYSFLDYSDSEKKKLKEMELYLEKELCVPIYSNINKINESDIIISDMYLPKLEILKILKNTNVKVDVNKIYLSCDLNMTKASGEIFIKVKKDFNIRKHTGDNLKSDYFQAIKNFIPAAYFNDVHKLTQIEKKWLECGKNNNFFSGALRATRLAKPANVNSDIWVIYAQIISPVLIQFCEYILQEVLAKKIEKIYFLARDGQIIYKIFKKIINSRKLSINCEYMYASRQALHITGYSNIEDAKSWLLDKPHPLSLKKISERINVESKKLVELYNSINSQEINEDSELNFEDLNTFIHHDLFKEVIEKSSQKSFDHAYKYFDEIGLLDDWKMDKKIAYVDIGWHGRLQKSLDNICYKHGYSPQNTFGFYLGLMNSKFVNKERYFSFLFSPYEDQVRFNNFRHFDVLEYFLRADHSQVIKYDDINGVIFKQKLSSKDIQAISINHQAILLTLEYYLTLQNHLKEFNILNEKLAINQLKRLLYSPLSCEIQALNESRHSQDQLDSNAVFLVKKISVLDFMRYGKLGMWPEASAAKIKMNWFLKLRNFMINSIFLRR